MSFQVNSQFQSTTVAAAVKDLHRDANQVFGPQGAAREWTLTISRNEALATETFTLETSAEKHIALEAADDLGAAYGIYEISHRYLGVDPLWFWKELPPEPKGDFSPPIEYVESGTPAFRYRGWFINDEDLLAYWKQPAGSRFMDWPKREETEKAPPTKYSDSYENRLLSYYTPILGNEIMEMIFEAALRLRANLIIPASFIDVMNEPEADIIRAALKRGFYVSQHHVEPIGVSHFAYETWWHRQGKSPAFSYRTSPDTMRACWKTYAQKWSELAGDKLIWQVGLRGRGDRALWTHDPEAQAKAGELISQALADQLEIIKAVDPRPEPPGTLTLWLEGATLVKEGKLEVPEGIAFIFADNHLTQEMQEDFDLCTRDPKRDYGYYYHIAVWTMGPHLVQGPPPEKIAATVGQLLEMGDTYYAILNVSNIREHVMGAQYWTRQVWNPTALGRNDFLAEWTHPDLAPLYSDFLDAFPKLLPSWHLYDGSTYTFIHKIINHLGGGMTLDDFFFEIAVTRRQTTREALTAAIKSLTQVLEAYESLRPQLDTRYHAFADVNLRLQVIILRGLYRAFDALIGETPQLDIAYDALFEVTTQLPEGEKGQWRHWYRGDIKVGLISLSNRIEELKTQPILSL